MFTSKGLKRRIAVYLALALDILRSIPGTEPYIALIEPLIGAWGGAAVAHAATAKTLSQEKLAGLVSAIYALIALAPFVPVLTPLLPFLYKAAGILSTLKVGSNLIKE